MYARMDAFIKWHSLKGRKIQRDTTVFAIHRNEKRVLRGNKVDLNLYHLGKKSSN